MHLTVRGDRSRNIREAFSDIQSTMLITLVLVVAVIFAFLHNGSATLIPALALPFSILGTFAVMQVLDFTLDNLSMMALILSHRLRRGRRDRDAREHRAARREGRGRRSTRRSRDRKEIGFTILSMTMSLAAVFIPILFMGGILGRLFREFAVTITAAILISGVVSVTLTPMLCSRFLNAGAIHGKGAFARMMEARLRRMYRVLRVEPRRSSCGIASVMLLVFFAVLAGTVEMFIIVPKGFIPDQDNDTMNINLRAAQGTSYYEMVDNAKKVAEMVRKDPNVDTFFVSTGGNRSMNTARLNVQLVPRRQRKLSAAQVVQQLRPQLSRFPGFQVFMNLPPAIQIGGRQSNSAYNLTVRERRHRESVRLGPTARRRRSRRCPELQDVSDDMEMKSPRVDLVVDRDQAAAVGLTVERHRRRALQRLRPAVGVDDLRRQGAIQGAARARSERSGAGRLAEEDLVQDRRRARSCRSNR